MRPSYPADSSSAFDDRLSPLAAFLVTAALLPVVVFLGVRPLAASLFGLDPNGLPVRIGLTAFSATLLFALGVSVFHWEAVPLEGVGFSRSHVLWAGVWFLGTVLVLNAFLLVAALIASDGWRVALGGVTPSAWVALAVVNWLFVGVAEELTARAYLQNKLHAVLPIDDARVNTLAAIVLMAGLFALWHIPQRLLVTSLDVTALPGSLVSVFVLGIVFGAVYTITRNVVLTAFLHGAWNFPPIFLSIEGTQIWQSVLVLAVIVLPFLGLLIAYYRWVTNPGVTHIQYN